LINRHSSNKGVYRQFEGSYRQIDGRATRKRTDTIRTTHHDAALLFGRAVRNAAAVILALSARYWNRIEYPTLPTLPANRKRETGKVYRITLYTPPRSYKRGA